MSANVLYLKVKTVSMSDVFLRVLQGLGVSSFVSCMYPCVPNIRVYLAFSGV